MNLSPTPFRAALTIVACACLAIPPIGAIAKCQLQSFDIPVTMKHTRAVAQLRINGTPVPFTIDSGAFFSAMTEAAAAQLDLRSRPINLAAWGLTGRVNYRVTRVKQLGLQNSEVKDVDFLVGGNEPGAGTLGLLGRNVLDLADTEYDIGNGIVRLMSPSSDCAGANLAYWAGTTPVVEVPLIAGFEERQPAIKAKALINGKPVTALFDTGALSILSLDAARRVGLLDDKKSMVPAGTVFGVGSGERPSWTVPMQTFELGTERITNSRLRVVDMIDLDDIDMLIGIDFFLSHRIYVARSQDRMFFTYTGGPVFDLSTKTAVPAQTEASPNDTPQDAPALARRGAAYEARNELAHALEDLDRAVALAPAVAAYRAQRARVQLRLKQRESALADLDEALRLDADAHEARLERAWLRKADAGSLDKVRADLQLLDQRVPAPSNLRRSMGELFIAIDEPLQAVRQYDQWAAAHPREADLHMVLNSRCWARALGNVELDKALDDCNEAVDAKPQEAAYLDSRGLVHLRLGQWKKAINDYDAALALAPRRAWSLWGRGLARIALGDRAQGLSDIAAARAIEADIEAQASRHGLGLPAGLTTTDSADASKGP